MHSRPAENETADQRQTGREERIALYYGWPEALGREAQASLGFVRRQEMRRFVRHASTPAKKRIAKPHTKLAVIGPESLSKN